MLVYGLFAWFMVTETARNGKHISTIGILPNEEMNNKEPAKTLCEAVIVNGETGYQEDYVYVFTFVEGYCIIAAMPKSDVMFMRDASLYTSVFMQVLIFAFLFVVIYVLIKKVIINNLKKINNIAMLLGDDLNDISQIFSDCENAVDRVALTIDNMENWGSRWIVFPNSVYGSAANFAAQYGYLDLFETFDYTDPDSSAWAIYD